jgi:hypothetical protein
MDLLEDIPGIIRKSMKHFVVCEPSCTNVRQPRFDTSRARPQTIVHYVVEFPVLGDRCVEDLLREAISTNVPTNGNGIPSERLDLLSDELSFLFVQAAEVGMSMGFRDGENG